MEVTTIATPAMWAAFTAIVLGMLALDLGVFHRQAHVVRTREAAVWSAVWVGLALAFNAWLAATFGGQRGLEFLTGYLIEKALAVDNIFIFLVIFGTFRVPAAYQHRVLFWGILGALAMRALFIFAGAALLSRFHWIIYLFGAFLLLTGFKLLWQRDVEPHPEHNPLFRWLTRLVPSVPDYHGSRFVVRRAGRRVATPLLLVLVLIEVTDLVFAIDSIPAIFAVTTDPFLVYTSNIFAILGLRAMFFLLAGAVDRFHYLKVGLAFILMFVGAKMVLADLYQLPIVVSLGVIAGILATAVAASLLRERTGAAARPAAGRVTPGG
jgi:tellurite resistance protein TerC